MNISSEHAVQQTGQSVFNFACLQVWRAKQYIERYLDGIWLSKWNESWERLLVVTTKNLSQDSFHPDDEIPLNYVIPGFKPFASIKRG